MIPVVWLNLEGERISRGYWDQGLLEAVFDRSLHPVPRAYDFSHHDGFDFDANDWPEGAVVVIPARHNIGHVETIQVLLDRLEWALVILTGDEESAFPWQALDAPNRMVWVQTPDPRKPEPDAKLGDYWPPATHHDLAHIRTQIAPEPFLDWAFAGQVVNNDRRQECTEALMPLVDVDSYFRGTEGFTLGLDRRSYLSILAQSRIAPCPSGPCTPDTFRLFEALEAGCVPVVDDAAPLQGPVGYWEFLFDGEPPFPILHDWSEFEVVRDRILEAWPRDANRCFSWWRQERRRLAYRMRDDLAELTAPAPIRSLSELVTVVIPSSPIPSHPSTAVLEETLQSIVDQPIGDAEILLLLDGVRPEQEHRHQAYEEYQRRLLRLCDRFPNLVPVRFDDHRHQSGMVKSFIHEVRTPLLVFVEHDTPLVGEIDWPSAMAAVESGQANVVRFYHEAQIHPEHQSLMLDPEPKDVEGAPLLRTFQWSQRPHLASTDFYRHLMETYFGPGARTMIEDVLHGVLSVAHHEEGEAGWERFRTFVYAPEGEIKRSTHLDARGADPKYPMVFDYPGDTPTGAPQPS